MKPWRRRRLTKGWSHEEYFEQLIRGETDLRWDNAITAPDQDGPLPCHQNPGPVPMELAGEDQPDAGETSLPARFYQGKGQRNTAWRCRPWVKRTWQPPSVMRHA